MDLNGAKNGMGKLAEKLKPAIRTAADRVGEAGQAKLCEYTSQAVDVSREVAAETTHLSGDERKKKMKELVMRRVRAPFPVRWGLSPLVGRVVGIAVDFDEIRDCVCRSSASPQDRREASTIILKKLNAPFYLRWAAKPVIGYALDVATEYAPLLNFGKPPETAGEDRPDPADDAD